MSLQNQVFHRQASNIITSTTMSTIELQQYLFQFLKSRHYTNTKQLFVDELADLLSLSTDSMYRRIRGETELTLGELRKLCQQYQISMDKLLNSDVDTVLFHYDDTPPEQFNQEAYLQKMADGFSLLRDSSATLLFSAKDLPVFYNYLSPIIGEFKYLFWDKTIFKREANKKRKFSTRDLNEKHIELGQQIVRDYVSIDSIEIWNDEILNSLLKQIRFYYESDFFEREEDVILLFDEVYRLLDHLEHQTETACKYVDKPLLHQAKKVNWRLYYNEIRIGHNSVIINQAGHYQTYIAYSIIQSLETADQAFGESFWQTQQQIIANSTLISTTAEKIRIRFFNKLRKKVKWLQRELLELDRQEF